MIRIAGGALWLGVGLAKMAALALAIDGQAVPAGLALLAAFALATAALALRRFGIRPH